MLLAIEDVLTKELVNEARRVLAGAEWVDGRVTAGYQASEVKRNAQVKEGTAEANAVGEMVLTGLARSPRFMSAALPLRVFPPMFNSYAGGQTFGTHVDTAIRQVSTTGQRIRTDLSATLFLTEPDEYDGGELVVEDSYGEHKVKLPAGHMVLYPATSLHRVEPVTRGNRVSSFFWIQSMVRHDAQRTLLFDLDSSIQRLAGVEGDEVKASAVQLTGVYHNLLRQWSEM
ncbi:Fe2+-dependent dioxygenase [Granulicella tundricola]|uniref:2OG-Fe(II) oxygenase n=1 Tax=Granulicella tundricola (strain ATCC BAA-1859 / DSM 23138 / MP5ACTX9) TaxID=1198114 RepID=E8WXQ6_GRATM|nr:Fe2+-dependent dioxygenase [Granulicella tundricola]ADW69751.1 2OG-Fe(II) oxygenase [Granulicella tundricola MP5ACTX9]